MGDPGKAQFDEQDPAEKLAPDGGHPGITFHRELTREFIKRYDQLALGRTSKNKIQESRVELEPEEVSEGYSDETMWQLRKIARTEFTYPMW